MNAYELMMRLGLSLAGTNADLTFVAPPSDEGGDDEQDDEGESGDESGDEQGGGSESGDEQDDDEQGGGSESGDGSGGEGDRDMSGGEGGESSGVPSDAKSDNGQEGKSNTKGAPSEQDGGGKGAGGGSTTRDGEQFDAQAFAQDLLAAMGRGDEAGVKDLANALAEAVKAAHEDAEGEVEQGEAPWNPYTTANDKVVQVPADPGARDAGQKLLGSVRREVSFLRARLRNKFLEAKAPRVMHGVKNGETLSERLLANTWVEVQSGIAPTRPDTRTVHRDKVTIAVAVVVDQSGSMASRKTEAARALVAICAPLDEVGCPVLAVGFRNGYIHAPVDEGEVDPTRPYHRDYSVDIDIFKSWDEPVRNCLGRFTKVKATGGTPMCDGIQFALQALSARKERHRILLVITDGAPDWGHAPVIRRQQRLAREAGIALVGVGIDHGCRSVGDLYEKHVIVRDVSNLPEQLLNTINDLVFPRGPARKVTLDGNMNTRGGRAA